MEAWRTNQHFGWVCKSIAFFQDVHSQEDLSALLDTDNNTKTTSIFGVHELSKGWWSHKSYVCNLQYPRKKDQDNCRKETYVETSGLFEKTWTQHQNEYRTHDLKFYRTGVSLVLTTRQEVFLEDKCSAKVGEYLTHYHVSLNHSPRRNTTSPM